MPSATPFPSSEFDHWAETYDRDVVTQDTFPFAGYEQALRTVVDLAAAEPGMTVLDIGTGTGNLALRFGELGCQIWGSDFSRVMLQQARRKVPAAKLVVQDLGGDWPAELDRRFDRIVSAYVFHHFTLRTKVRLVGEMALRHLEPEGRLVIADLSFPDEAARRAFALSVGDLWEEEHYWLADESISALTEAGLRVGYWQVSACAGVYCADSRAPVRAPG
jgi:ubiquinone/menaquinone biosynthesis C-methylase UbiE